MNKSDKQLLFLALAALGIPLLAGFAPVLSQSANAIICRFEATPCETVWNGNDDVFYRDAGGTETIRVDGQGSMRIAVPTQVGTATPGLVIQSGGPGNGFEIRNAGATPVFQVDASGGVTSQNTLASGSLNNVIVSQPTAATTATPAALINSLAAGSELLTVRKASTPVFVIGNAGAITGQDANLGGNVVIAPPTAIATATPALLVNNTGAGNNILSIRQAATPVFVVGNSGAVTGYVFSSAVSGRKCVQGTQTITGTGTIAHGLSTPVAVQLSLAEDVTGDGARLSYTNAAAVVTAKVWDSAATPAAAQAGHLIDYTVCGTP